MLEARGTALMPSGALLSVVVPTCNRSGMLGECLSQLTPESQKLPPGYFEVIVTDDGADDAARAMVSARFGWAKWVRGPRRGPAANRNNGAREATGEWLVFIDDDCVPQPGLLEAYCAAIAEHPECMVFEGRTSADRAQRFPWEESPVNEAGNAFHSCNVAYEKDFFFKLGGFDEQYPYPAMEDLDLASTAIEAGARTFFVSSAAVIHPWRTKDTDWHVRSRHSLRMFLRKHPHHAQYFHPRRYLRAAVAQLSRCSSALLRLRFRESGYLAREACIHALFALDMATLRQVTGEGASARAIAVLNNFSFNRVQAEVASGHKPAHHLYGIDELSRAGYEVRIVESDTQFAGALSRFSSWLQLRSFPVPLGDLGQQWRVLTSKRRFVLVYSPCQTQTQLLSYLRAIRLFRTPVLMIAHHPPAIGRLALLRRPFFKLAARGTDIMLSHSTGVAEQINTLTHNGRSEFIPWGPDLGYYSSFSRTDPPAGKVFHASGRTGRDFGTFVRGAMGAGAEAEVYCLEKSWVPAELEAGAGSRVCITCFDAESNFPYDVSLRKMADARAICIPLFEGNSLMGLTSLADALGLGKPVIMTKNRYIDLDIESVGMGFWVEPGDVAGWRTAMERLRDSDTLYSSMCSAAKIQALSAWNYRIFNERLLTYIRRITDAPVAVKADH